MAVNFIIFLYFKSLEIIFDWNVRKFEVKNRLDDNFSFINGKILKSQIKNFDKHSVNNLKSNIPL